MIEIYREIGQALTNASRLNWIDIGPRTEDQTNLDPAAFIMIDRIKPITSGFADSVCEIEFTTEIWAKPYHSSATKPLSPVLDKLSDKMVVIHESRKAIADLEGDWVRGTELLEEKTTKQPDGYYKTVLKWKATTTMNYYEDMKLKNIPKLVIEKTMM